MTDSDLNRRLAAYLDAMGDESAQASIRKAIADCTNQVQLLGLKLDNHNTLLSERIAGLSARVEKLEQAEETTGSHNLATLETKLKEERASKDRLFWAVLAAVGSVLLLGLGGAGTIVWYLLTKGHAS